jgi:hypothetical protein
MVGAQLLPGSAGASSVTIWGSRVAWVGDHKAVLIRRLGTFKTTHLAGAPTHKCHVPYPQEIHATKVTYARRCGRTNGGSVGDLELDGSRVAIIDSFFGVSGVSGAATEVRMQSVIGGPQRLVALMNRGEGGQTWVGPSWAKGHLFFVKSCLTCENAEATYRYHPDSGIYGFAPRHIRIAGFAMDEDGRRAFQVLGLPGNREALAGEHQTSLRISDALTFIRVRPPIAGL